MFKGLEEHLIALFSSSYELINQDAGIYYTHCELLELHFFDASFAS